MKQILILISALILCTTGYSQINAYYVISSAGTFAVSESKATLSTTIGEMALVKTFSAGGYTLTQGFQQGSFIKYLAVALPVKLLDFDGYNKESVNHLYWQTASEINNAGFDLERLNSNGEFEKIGYVEGHGTTNSLQDYQFDDTRPLPGDNYYRLKQIDVDGHFTHSDVVSIYSGTSISTDMSVYPMPITSVMNVLIHNTGATTGSMTISNIVGEIIVDELIEVYEGTTIKKIDLSAYASGQYFVRLTTGSASKTVHIVKQ